MRTSKGLHGREARFLGILAIGLAALAVPVPATAGPPLNLTFEELGGGPPEIEVVDGTVVFKITPVQSVSGDLTGTLTEKITQVFPAWDDDHTPIAAIWTLETPDGTIEGSYSGTFQHLPDGSHLILQRGTVLSVTGAYADLFLARVNYRAVLAPNHFNIAGRMSIVPRP